MNYSFFIKGRPKGKGRPRFTRTGHAYTPKTTAAYENLIKQAFVEQIHGDDYKGPLKGPLYAIIEAHFRTPNSISEKKKGRMWGNPYAKKPDVDNIVKVVLDALNGLAFEDDKQVCEIRMSKKYAFSDESEGVTVTIVDWN